MKSVLIRCFTLVIAFVVSLSAGWAAGSLRVRNIGMEDGLMSNAVRNIVQDKYGYMWFGTDNGLCRYDGISVSTYRIAQCGVNQYVSALLATDGGLYVGMDCGVFFFSFATSQFELLPLDVSSTITCLTTDKDGNLWVSAAEQGVWRYGIGNRQSKHFPFDEIAGHVAQVYVDASNQVWTASNTHTSAVCRLNRLHDRFESVDYSADAPYNSLCMLQTRDGRFWLGTWERGLMLMHSDGTLEQVLAPETEQMGTHIHTLYEGPDDAIYIGCDDGILTFNPHTRQCRRLLDEDTQNNRFVYAITTDREGGLWIGTFYGGVFYVSPYARRFDAFTTGNGLKGNVIARFCEDRQGNVWIASDDGGLMCYQPTEQRFADYPHRDELATVNAHALAIDGDELWIGTYTRGVYVLNTVSGQLRHYPGQGARGLLDASSYAICHDTQHRTWVGTMEGLYGYERESDTFRHIGSTNGLVIDIDEDRHHCLWLSTQGAGLWRYNPADQSFRQYQNQANDNRSLPHDQVNCGMTDEDGRLWIGTAGGLCYYDAAADNFVRVPLSVPSSNVMSIIEDQGILWLSTERGIVRYEPQPTANATQRFTRHDGLVSEQFQPNAGIKASNGRIYFGAAAGFNSFFPYQIKTNTTPPPVYINALEMFNQPSITDDGLPLDLSQFTEIGFNHDEAQMLTFSFVSLSYCSPEKNQYAYMLEGFDKDWNIVSHRNHATYTNLPAGTYTFRVKATNNDGIWSDHEASIKIVVHPPFWWSWYAKLFYLLATIALVWYCVRLILKRAERRHQIEMQHMQEQKEKEVREARLNFFTMVAHEIRTPLSLIIGPLEKIKEELRVNSEKFAATIPSGEGTAAANLEIIDRNAHRLLELVNQLLDFRKVEQQMLTMNPAPTNIRELLQAVCVRFAPTIEQGGRQFTAEYPDEHFTAIVDGEAITKVVSNLLTNANKYTRSRVDVRCIVEGDDEHFRITVSDDGVGIREEDRQRIFEPFFQAQDNKPGTGIGLNIVKNIVELHHGTISVDSEVGRGSTFTVVLPVGTMPATLPSSWQKEKYADDDVPPSAPATKPDTAAATTASHGKQDKPTLLIVDDSEDMAAFLADSLGKKYEVTTTHDGIEALHQLSRQNFSLIVSDWMMPRMDGAELCRQVRRNPMTSHIPFIMLTAKTDDGSKVEGMDIGADAYIEKPFSVEYVEACIRNIIAIRRQLFEKFSTEPFVPATDMASNDTDNEFLKKMTKVIEDNISNSDLSVALLAEELGISRSGLFAKIKAIADITPNEMIQIIRLKRAAALLREGKYLISEVGYNVGFSNPSYFSKCFLKQFGVRPVDYVKQQTRR